MIEYIKLNQKQARYSLFIAFTRDWLLDDFFEMLDGLVLPLSDMEFVFYNDTDNMSLHGRLRDYLESKESLNNALLYRSGNISPTETSSDMRRDRIVDMKNKSRELLSDSDYTICIEDDTFMYDAQAVMKLIEKMSDKIGFVSGVERGRWGIAIIGAWGMDDIKNPSKVWTLPYKEHGYEPVDGAGMYFYITPTSLYKAATYHYDAECLGPDVCYVMDLRKQGYQCLVDWDLPCVHRTNSMNLIVDNRCAVVEYSLTNNDWQITSIV